MDEAIKILVVGLDRGKYAQVLATMIWGETPFQTAKGLTLDDPQELLSAALSPGSP